MIPCYNQAALLADALSSVIGQSHACMEAIVVDDGSTEDVESVVRRYPGTRYLRQPNLGVAAARNTGFACCRGDYVIFLDSDDRLAPDGIVHALRALDARPDAAAAVGLCRVIDRHGEPRPFTQQAETGSDIYRELLGGNFIWMPAQVIYRRRAFAQIGGFDSDVDACADYDLYLRLARTSIVEVHRFVVAEYRQHEGNMSLNAARMLSTTLAVLERQRPHVAGNADHQRALEAGRRFWRDFYGDTIMEEIRIRARTQGSRVHALRSALVLLRHHPRRLIFHLARKLAQLVTAPIRRFRRPA